MFQGVICYKRYVLDDLERLQTNQKNSKSAIFCRGKYEFIEMTRRGGHTCGVYTNCQSWYEGIHSFHNKMFAKR